MNHKVLICRTLVLPVLKWLFQMCVFTSSSHYFCKIILYWFLLLWQVKRKICILISKWRCSTITNKQVLQYDTNLFIHCTVNLHRHFIKRYLLCLNSFLKMTFWIIRRGCIYYIIVLLSSLIMKIDLHCRGQMMQ